MLQRDRERQTATLHPRAEASPAPTLYDYASSSSQCFSKDWRTRSMMSSNCSGEASLISTSPLPQRPTPEMSLHKPFGSLISLNFIFSDKRSCFACGIISTKLVLVL